MKHSSSSGSDTRRTPVRYLALGLVAVVAVALPTLGGFGALVTSERYIVTEDAVITEDQYVTAVSAVIEGVIEGNLTIFAGDVTITGTVTGSVNAFSSGTVRVGETGSVGGALNGAAVNLSVLGDVGSDVFFTAGSAVFEEPSTVGRDAITFGGTSRFEGAVGRDVRGRSVRTTVFGSVDGDVDIATTSLSIGPDAEIAGDILYRSNSDASIAEGAVIGGTVTRLPTQSNFIYGIVLSLANLISFLGFLVAGLVALALFRGTGSRAVGVVLTKPIRSLLTGIAVVLVAPLLIVLMAITLVGIPLAIVGIALGVAGLIIGAVPAVTALGNRVLMNRGGVFGAFIVGAVIWRLGIWLIPYVGGVLFVLGVVWGIGAWVLGAVAARSAEPIPPALLPASLVAPTDTPDWEPPLAPGASPSEPEPYPAWVDSHDSSAEPAGGGPVAEEPVAGSPTGGGEPAAGTRPPPDPSVERDTSYAEAPVGFGPPAARSADNDESAADTEFASLDEQLRAFRSELEQTSEPEAPPPFTSDRFDALRDEVRSGSVEPPTSSDPHADDADTSDPDRSDPEPDSETGDDDDWGLPGS